MLVARQFLAAAYRRGLHRYRSDWFAWDGRCWSLVPDDIIASDIWLRLEDASYWETKTKQTRWRPNKARIANVLAALEAASMLSGQDEPPFWREDVQGAPAAQDILSFRNCLLDTGTLETSAHDPRLFVTHAASYDYDSKATCPRWLKFLSEVADEATRNTLQEAIGYVLSNDTRQQKCFLIFGPRRSGKSTVLRILTALIGSKWVTSPSLSALGGNFGTESLLNKRVCLISDARVSRGAQGAVQALLGLVGEDNLSVPRKYKAAVETRLRARVVIATNELPQLNDNSAAMAGRIVPLSFPNTFFGREDVGLTDALLEELSGIALWAIAGLQRLRARGHFDISEDAKETVRELELLSAPIRTFVAQRAILGSGYTADVDSFWKSYRQFCDDSGFPPSSKVALGRDLAAAFGIRRVRRRHGDGRNYTYDGIGLRTEPEEEPEPFVTVEDVVELFSGWVDDCHEERCQ